MVLPGEPELAGEGALCAGACGTVLLVGLFARVLDAVEEQRAGKLKLQFSNLFCAAFTSCISVLYVSIAWVQAARGSWPRAYALLVGRESLTAGQEYQARVAHSLLLGYMLQDLVGRFWFRSIKWAFVLHHLATVVGIALCLWKGQSGLFGCALGISEASTPIVNTLEVSRHEPRLKPLFLLCGASLFFLWPVRVVMFSYLTYIWGFEHVEAPLGAQGNGKNLEVNQVAIAAAAMLSALNLFWWKQVIGMSMRVIFPPPKQPAEDTKADKPKADKPKAA